eukprot:6063769-Amphidinium_carterae.1
MKPLITALKWFVWLVAHYVESAASRAGVRAWPTTDSSTHVERAWNQTDLDGDLLNHSMAPLHGGLVVIGHVTRALCLVFVTTVLMEDRDVVQSQEPLHGVNVSSLPRQEESASWQYGNVETVATANAGCIPIAAPSALALVFLTSFAHLKPLAQWCFADVVEALVVRALVV